MYRNLLPFFSKMPPVPKVRRFERELPEPSMSIGCSEVLVNARFFVVMLACLIFGPLTQIADCAAIECDPATRLSRCVKSIDCTGPSLHFFSLDQQGHPNPSDLLGTVYRTACKEAFPSRSARALTKECIQDNEQLRVVSATSAKRLEIHPSFGLLPA